MELDNVKISTKGPFGTKININGKEIDKVVYFSISQGVGEMPKLELELYVTKVEIDGECVVEITNVGD